MAQVRKIQKMQNGGKTFKIAGYTFNTNNKEDMDMLQAMTSDANYGGIAQGILDNVNNANYANTLNAYRTADGRVVMEGELQEVKDKHMSAGTQKATSRKDNAFWNTFKRRSGKEWANDMDAFLSEITRRKNSTATISTDASDDKIKITGVSDLGGIWKYNDQGWDEADVNNEAMLKRWNLLEDYVKASEEERTKYDISDLNQDQLNAFISLYQKTPDLFTKYRPFFTKDKSRLENDDFYSTFGWFGFNNGVDDEEYAQKVAETEASDKYNNAGWDYNKWKDYGTVNDDGSLELYDGALGGYSSGNYMFNDYWANSKMNPGEEWLQGYTKIGNRLYKTSSAEKEGSALYNYLRRRGGFYDLNQSGDYTNSNALIEWMWDNPYYQTTDKSNIGDFHAGNYQYDPTNLRVDNTTWNGGTLNEGDQIVRYLNMSDNTGDYLGFKTPLYGIVDKTGNLVQSGLKATDFTNLFDGGTKEVMEAQQFLNRQRVSNDEKSPYYNMYKETVGDENDPLFIFYVNPATGESTMVPGNLLTNKTLGENVGIKNVGEATRKLFSDPKIINLIKTNPKFQKKLQNTIMSMTGTDWQDLFRGNFNKPKELMKFGLTEEEANTIIEAFYDKGSNKNNGRAYERRNNYLDYIPSNKNGGTLKAQQGTVLNAGTKQAKSNIDTVDESGKSREVTKHTEVGKVPGNQVLSRADVAELIAAGADVIGTVTGLFGPVGNVVGSAIGLGASATQLGVDISRDGFQLKDLGRFGLNAGLDVVGLVPVLGDAARTAKTIKTIKKVSKIASPLFIGMGLTAAAGSIDKIVNGEQLTVDDWTNLAAGFQSLTNAGVLGKQRYDMSKVASLTSKLPKNTPDIQYKHKIGDTEITLDKTQIEAVTSKTKKDAQKYLSDLFTKKGVEEKDIPADLIAKFGFKEGKTRWNKVSEQKQPKEITDRSTAGFFLRPGLNKYIDANSGNLKQVIENNDVDPRLAATLSRQYDLDLPLKDEKNRFKWTRMGVEEPVRWESGNLPQPPQRNLPEFNVRPSRMPWIRPRVEMGLVPVGGDVSTDGGVTFRRQSKVLEPTLIRRVKDVKPINQPRKPRRIGAPETTSPGIIIDNNGRVISMDRGQFNRMDAVESNTADLFVKYRKYQQAFNNVNSEKSFVKLLENIGNDVEFRLAMEENPGLLRQEMIEAASRVGLMGKGRKSLLSDNNLVFKKGGTLKVQPGIKMPTFKKSLDLSEFDSANQVGKAIQQQKTPFAPTFTVNTDSKTGKVTTSTVGYAPSWKATTVDYSTGQTVANPNATSIVTKATTPATTTGEQTANPSSARPTKSGGFNWAGLGSDLLEIGNAARALKESNQIYDIDRKMAEITGRRTVKAPNILTNRRFMTPTFNQYNGLIGKYNTTIGQNISSDAFANMAARLTGADKTAEIMNTMNREVSSEFSNQQDKWNQAWQQQQLYNTDAANQNNQIQVSAALAGEQAKAGKLTRNSDIYNKLFNKAQYQLNNIASIDSQIQNQKYKIETARAAALAANKDADVSGYDNMLAELNKPEYRQYLLNARKYGMISAKKGTKLRSTTEQMLLNNQKIVARAIEKLNDNTMKLILKALS